MFSYTDHARVRAKQRYEGKLYDFETITELGYKKGDFRKGSGMRKYLDRFEKKSGGDAIIYDKKVFIVRDNVVITTWRIPNRFMDAYDWDGEDEY